MEIVCGYSAKGNSFEFSNVTIVTLLLVKTKCFNIIKMITTDEKEKKVTRRAEK